MNHTQRKILIVGGGRVGQRALDFCKENNFIAVIVDDKPDCLVRKYVDIIEVGDNFEVITKLQGNKAILFVTELSEIPRLLQSYDFEYTIPAVPIHLMGKLCYDYLRAKKFQVKPAANVIRLISKRIDQSLIINYSEKDGIIIASFMPKNQNCAQNCVEYLRCPVTKIQKPKPLYEIFQDACQDFPSMIFISEQLKPNLGGIPKKSMDKFLHFLDSINQQVIIGTSCMCHGVLNAFKIEISE